MAILHTKNRVTQSGQSFWQERGRSDSDSAPGSASRPTGVSVTAHTASTLTVGWSASSAGSGGAVTGYNVYVDGTLQGTAPTVAAGTLTYQITGLAASNDYDIDIRAVNAAGLSGAGSVLGTTDDIVNPGGTPAAPTVSAAVVDTDSARADWTPATTGAAATGWNVYRDGTTKVSGTTPLAAGTRTFQVDGLAAGSRHTYTVRGVNASGEGAAGTSPQVTQPTVATKLAAIHIPRRVLVGYAGAEAQSPSYDEFKTIISPGGGPFAYVRRIFPGGTWSSATDAANRLTSDLNSCDNDGVVCWGSEKVPNTDWAGVRDGDYDNILNAIRGVAVARRTAGKRPFLWTIHHEPAGNGDFNSGAATWAQMQEYLSNYFADVNDIMTYSSIGNAFFWNGGGQWDPAGQAQTYPQSLIDAHRVNKGVAAVDTYDGTPPYTGQESISVSDVPVNGRSTTKGPAYIQYMRDRNCGLLGFGESGHGSPGVGYNSVVAPNVPGMTDFWNVIRANRDIVGIWTYFNSIANSKWDWRMVPADYPDMGQGALDHGGTALTGARLLAYRDILAQSTSALYTT